MLLIKKNDFELHTPVRLVKAEEVAAVRTADEVIAAAEEEAARIRNEAQLAFEEERKKGYAKGIEDSKAAVVARQLELVQERSAADRPAAGPETAEHLGFVPYADLSQLDPHLEDGSQVLDQ